MSYSNITPKQLHEEIRSGKKVTLIDVRTPAEYGEVHVTCARTCRSIGFPPPSTRRFRSCVRADVCHLQVRRPQQNGL